jgi:hypothetical protein
MVRRFASTLTVVSLLAVSASARAGSMDLATDRLVLQPQGSPGGSTCQQLAADPEIAVKAGTVPNNFPCRPDNIAFANLVSELGFAIAPTAFHPARTTGFGGFALTMEASYTKINSDAFSTASDGTQRQYWHEGTRGDTDQATGAFSTKNTSPSSILSVYSLKARKGLPLGFEATGVLGYIPNSTMWSIGADVSWAPLEGFRTGVLGILPDLSVGGGVRSLVGTDKLTLTTVGLDVKVSKLIPVAESVSFTPYLGFQRLWVFGDSSIIDSTPNTDPISQCGYTGIDKVTGAPNCANKLSTGAPSNGDFNNNFVFQKVRTQRNRGIVGVAFRYEMLYLASQFLIDLTSPQGDDQPFLQADRMWTMSFDVGAFF